MDDTERLISKMDVFSFDYTDKESQIDGYAVGKAITDQRERYITHASINPKDDDMFSWILYQNSSIDDRTIIIDYRLLEDNIIEILKTAYKDGIISGIRIIPEDYILTKDKFDKLNHQDFYGFLVAVNKISDDIDNKGNYLDIREQKGLCEIEHIAYHNGEDQDHFNVHITRKLNKEEIHSLVLLIKQHNYQNLLIDFYEPSYYQDLLKELEREGLPRNIIITFLGNPLYDDLTCYEKLSSSTLNEVRIHYNTCNDLNRLTREGPHTEGARYYSDIEASGLTDANNYYEMIKMLDGIVDYMEEKGYSPLEKIAYLNDYFKKNFIYDPDYLTNSHSDNANLDKVYCKDRMICEGFSNLYSAILRRAGLLCFTYGTDDHQKNIVRVTDPKYGIDNIAILDPTFDLSADNNRNVFKNFLLPIDNDLFAYAEDELGRNVAAPSVINIPSCLSMASEYYYAFINDSNPVYATDPMGYAIRMLQLMGLTDPGIQMTPMERAEYYKSALERSHLTNKIPYDVLARAVSHVREEEQDYSNSFTEEEDKRELEESLRTRGYNHLFDPQIRLFDGTSVPVKLYHSDLEVDFIHERPQSMIYKRPRKRKENETIEDFSRYLHEFYDTMFYRRYEEIDNMENSRENLEEFDFVEEKEKQRPSEIVIYRDVDDLGRTFVTQETLHRFHMTTPEYKIILDNGVEIYEIRPQEATYIIDHANNKYAPYSINYQSFDFNNELDDAKQQNQNEEKPIDEIQIFRDVDDSGRAFVTEEVLERFHIDNPKLKVLLSNMIVYEIDPVQAINIINNSNNPYAPYTIRYVSIQFDKTPVIPYRDDLSTVKTPIIPYNDALSTVKDMEEEKEEYIPGTKYKKPRARKPYESDDHYVAYLEGYYDSIFNHEEVAAKEEQTQKEENDVVKPRVRGIHESDEAYTEYLRNYYNKIFNPETQEKVSSRKLILQRKQREGESDEDYIEYLAMFYGTPEIPQKEEHKTK